MRKFFIVVWFLSSAGWACPQQLSQLSFSGGTALSYLSFLTDQGVLIRISDDGKILEWGFEVKADRFEYYAPKLQPFMGRVDYYGPESDSAFRGKVKSIGTCIIRYFGPYEMDTKAGKIMSIGSVMIDYYSMYDNASLKGKIRFAGNHVFDYYSSAENEAYRGKLKSVGTTSITYYSSFDDKLIRGKLKSIGGFTYKWRTSLDGRYYRNEMKPGWQRQYINGILYVII